MSSLRSPTAPPHFGDRYEIIRTLGEGGMGVVYEALDRERGVRVALKAMQRLDAGALYRFKNEFRALAGVAHPNLIQLHELVADDDRTFFTMELVHGLDFMRHVRGSEARQVSVSKPTIDADTIDVKIVRSAPTAREERHAPPADEGRLRDALRQLVEGVDALHGAGRLHRDLKPPNVMVAHDGRVVVLDFGLVSSLADEGGGGATLEHNVVGTPEYMSPEQAAGSELSEASDWYSVGVMLYEALAGVRPFSGAPLKILLDKQQYDPEPPTSEGGGVPEDLVALCVGLLRRIPSQRPSRSEIRAAVGAGTGSGGATARQPTTLTLPTLGNAFVGREPHTRALTTAFDDVRKGKTVAVLVRGSSGMGKSSLVKRFIDALAQSGEAVVLCGRCYEQESMPFKALDSVVDALSRYLRKIPRAEADAVLPREIHALTRLFPVLARVEAVTARPRRSAAVPDPQEVQRRAFGALRELFTRISDRRPLVVWIDDLQWSDVDSVGLVREILRPPDAPAILLVATYRSEEAASTALVSDLLLARDDGKLDVRDVEVGPLGADEARELALRLLARDDEDGRAQAVEIAEESRGNPLFVDELVRFARGSEGRRASGETASLRLEDVLHERVSSLPEDAKRLLDVVAVAGRPLAREAAQGAAELASDAEATALAVLRAGRFVRTSRTHNRYEIECFHDRVRGTVTAHLSPDARKEIHWRLAIALVAAGSADAEALVVHFQESGHPQRAGEFAAIAAAKAVDALAFDRAADLWQRALDLQSLEGAAASAVRRKLGDALANGGRGARAARAYQEAARGAAIGEALDLQRRAAEQLLRSGNFDEGVNAIKTVLALIHYRFPSSPAIALLIFLIGRLWTRLRGYSFRIRDTSAILPSDITRADIFWSIAFGIALIDPIRGAAFQTRYLHSTLQLGEVNRVARALASEAAYTAALGSRSWRRTMAIFARCDALVPRVTMPDALGWVPGSKAFAYYVNGRFREALTFADEALAIFRERCVGVQWELDTAESIALWAVANLGEMNDLRTRRPAYAREAKDRGDKYGAVLSCSGDIVLLWLADDDPERARRELDLVMGDWSKQAFHFEHFCELISRTHVDLYAGRATEARDRIAGAWPALERSLMRRLQSPRMQSTLLRARTSIAVAQAGVGDTGALLRSARRDADAIEREDFALASAYAAITRAGIASVEGRRAEAGEHLARAIAGFDALGMKLHAAVARHVRPRFVDGAGDTPDARESEAWLHAQSVMAPEKMARALAPGLV